MILWLLLLSLTLLTRAQDKPLATPDAATTVETAPIALVTPAALATSDAGPLAVNSGGGSVTINTGGASRASTLPASTDPQITMSLWQLLAGAASAFSLGGLTIGTGIAVMASRLRHNATTMAALEYLAAGTPDTTIKTIDGLMDKFQAGLMEAFALVREATDKIPAASKTPEEREAVLYPSKLTPDPTGFLTSPTRDNPSR